MDEFRARLVSVQYISSQYILFRPISSNLSHFVFVQQGTAGCSRYHPNSALFVPHIESRHFSSLCVLFQPPQDRIPPKSTVAKLQLQEKSAKSTSIRKSCRVAYFDGEGWICKRESLEHISRKLKEGKQAKGWPSREGSKRTWRAG